mmetsp:Transcript_17542/g.35370  ORF Transcript_17542/g.35370 Transcript_17542/m.35370 type:complete len:484 (+) Transcript_17542:181-1632(+)
MSNPNSNHYSSAAMLYLAITSLSCEFAKGLIVGNQLPPILKSHHRIGRGFISRSQRAFQSPNKSRNKRNRAFKMYLDDMLPTAISSIGSSLASSSILEAASSTIATTTSTMISPSSSSQILIPPPSTITSFPPLSPTTVATLLSTTSQLLAADPKLEAELLSDVSHVALDFTTFFSPNNTAWIRFCNVIGRILILSSDYIQDDYITPDEFVFQASMLMVSIQLFVKSVWPVLHAAMSQTQLTVRDRRAYTEVFDTVGLTILQFRTLLASETLAWEELEFGEEVDLKNDLCFLYSGQVADASTVHCSSSGSNSSCNTSSTSKIGSRIFGEVPFSKATEEAMYNKKNKKSINSSIGNSTPSKVDQVNASLPAAMGSNFSSTSSSPSLIGKLTACGPNGAILLRISTPKLLQLMNDDDQLAASMHRLVLLSMQEKLSRAFVGNVGGSGDGNDSPMNTSLNVMNGNITVALNSSSGTGRSSSSRQKA